MIRILRYIYQAHVRPAWSYHKLQHIKPHKVLCIDYENKTHEIFEIKDTSVIRWLADNLGHVRNVWTLDDIVNPVLDE